MNVPAALAFLAALLCLALAAAALVQDRRSVVHRLFAAGLILTALQEILVRRLSGGAAEAILRGQRWHLLLEAAVTPVWLLFSLSFGRTNSREFIERWRHVLAALFAVPLLAAVSGWPPLFAPGAVATPAGWVLPLSTGGFVLQVLMLLGAVLVLGNLERTLRASSGSMRWRLKFMTLGLGAAFAVQIYSNSQALLFRSVRTELQVVHSAALVVAAVLMAVALVRSRGLSLDIYVSQAALFNSMAVLLAGVYLLAVGLLSRAMTAAGGVQAVPLATFMVFLAVVALAAVLLSDELRYKGRSFVSRHFQRPRYDYRKEWNDFTRRTTSLVNRRALCAAVARMVADTLAVRGVTLWILEDGREGLTFGGSTTFAESEAERLSLAGDAARELVRWSRDRSIPWDIHGSEFPHAASDLLTDVRYCVSLNAGGELLGILAISDRISQEPISPQDLDLLKTLADQTAASLMSLRLSERLLRAKEMEAFQTLSAFFIHDLKNLASKLSLTLQNLPAHYDDPGFRADMLALMSRSVTKINDMCSKLSPLSRKLEIHPVATDLSLVVQETLAGLEGAQKARLVCHLPALPAALIDAEQFQKVVLNLVLNAQEAVDGDGEVRVNTRMAGDCVELAVSDNGCGMSPDFVARHLFQPFQSSKSRGLGIGLFHSKKIVEAHHGRIEVESQEKKGTTFRVLLPVAAP